MNSVWGIGIACRDGGQKVGWEICLIKHSAGLDMMNMQWGAAACGIGDALKARLTFHCFLVGSDTGEDVPHRLTVALGAMRSVSQGIASIA